jgi:hypothetical protein
MNRIQEQYEAAARQKQAIRNGTYADEGPRAADSADHALIAAAQQALKLLEARPSPNGIGFCATDPREVARRIREAATLVSCPDCGRLYKNRETLECYCHLRYEVDSAMLGEGGEDELRTFCAILQDHTSVEIVCVEDSYNGATSPDEDMVELLHSVVPWDEALEIFCARHTDPDQEGADRLAHERSVGYHG